MERTVLKTYDKLKSWLCKVSTSKELALDTELVDPNWLTLQIAGLSLCNGKYACYVDLHQNKDKAKIIEYISQWLSRDTLELLIMHNAPFDLAVLKTVFGLPKQLKNRWRIFDTMTVAHLLDERKPKSLKWLANNVLYLNRDERGIAETFPEAVKYGFSNETFYKYAIEDAVETWFLYEWQLPRLHRERLIGLWCNIEESFQWCLRDLLLNGIAADKDEMLRLQDQIRKHIFDLEIKLYQIAGVDYDIQPDLYGGHPTINADVNLKSPAQLAKLIQEKLKIELTEKTDSGALSTKNSVLEKLYKKTNSEFLKLLLEYRSATKLLNSFLEPLPEMIQQDGRIRVSFHNTVAVTGRVSASRLHQLPKDDTGPVPLRQCFIAPPGKKLIAADFKGQELRILAHVTKDETMLQALRSGVDLHQVVADEVGTTRDKAKAISFGLAYGKSAYGFARDWGVSEEEAQQFVDKYFAKFPKVRQAIEKCNRLVETQSAIRNLTGRIRRFDWVDKKALREAFNFLIQGVGADLMKKAASNIAAHLSCEAWNLKLVLTVHDELVYEVDEKYVEPAMELIRSEMERAGEQIGLRLPMLVDIGAGDNYAEAKKKEK